MSRVRPSLWEPPLSNLAVEEIAQLPRVDRRAVPQHDHSQRSLLPLLVRHADDRCLQDVRVTSQEELELDGRDPLTARLDDVLGPVRQGDLTRLKLVRTVS